MHPLPPSDPELDPILEAWKTDHLPIPNIGDAVISRLTQNRRPGIGSRIADAFAHLMPLNFYRWMPAAVSAACVLLTVGVWLSFKEHNRLNRDQLISAYMSAIDPVYRFNTILEGHPDPLPLASLASKNNDPMTVLLRQLEDEFSIDNAASGRLEALHSEYKPLIEDHHRKLLAEKELYEIFEARRKNNEVIDFMLLFEWVKRQESLSSTSRETTRKLLMEMLSVLPQEKRELLQEAIAASPQNPLI